MPYITQPYPARMRLSAWCGGGAANVLLKATSADRRGYLCKLGDFGLARLLDPSQHTHVSTQTYGALLACMRTRTVSTSAFAKLG